MLFVVFIEIKFFKHYVNMLEFVVKMNSEILLENHSENCDEGLMSCGLIFPANELAVYL